VGNDQDLAQTYNGGLNDFTDTLGFKNQPCDDIVSKAKYYAKYNQRSFHGMKYTAKDKFKSNPTPTALCEGFVQPMVTPSAKQKYQAECGKLKQAQQQQQHD
jgi:hypothetical protein